MRTTCWMSTSARPRMSSETGRTRSIRESLSSKDSGFAYRARSRRAVMSRRRPVMKFRIAMVAMGVLFATGCNRQEDDDFLEGLPEQSALQVELTGEAENTTNLP